MIPRKRNTVVADNNRAVRLGDRIARRLRMVPHSEGNWPVSYARDVLALVGMLRRSDQAFAKYWKDDRFDDLLDSMADARSFLAKLPKQERDDA